MNTQVGYDRCAALRVGVLIAASLLVAACLGGNQAGTGSLVPAPAANVVTVIVDGGPAAAPGQINHAYVTVKVCAAGSLTQCASIDHILLDTGSVGLRLVGSILSAQSVSLSLSTDMQGNAVEECATFSGGQTWGPIALADVTLAGETALKVPVQIMDDAGTSAAPPLICGANGSLINSVAGFGANGVLGLGVLTHDCGQACVNPAAALPVYYGCAVASGCVAENTALANQVTNVGTLFTADNNGIIIKMPNLVNVNGDNTIQGELIFGLSTQSDNALPTTGLTVLGADVTGRFTSNYNGLGTTQPSLIDSGTSSYSFDDPSITACSTGSFIGYYCPSVSPMLLSVINTGVGANSASSTLTLAISDPNTFVAGATAFGELGGGGGSTQFIWGMPFFYGRTVYLGFDQHTAASFTGPFYAY